MSQLSLFGDPPEDPKPTKPKPEPKPQPPPEKQEPIHAEVASVLPEWRCIVIACGCVTEGAEILGHPICSRHNTDRTREVMATGAWPAWYGYEGTWRIVPTVRRLDDLGHTWSRLHPSGTCETCGISYGDWQRKRFELPCEDYEQPDTRKGLFRP